MIRRWLTLPVITLVLCLGCSDPSTGSNRGMAGAGGAGAGGTGGSLPVPDCQTAPLCAACPNQGNVCDTVADCNDGYACIESGCATNEGVGINICALAIASFCLDDSQCPEGRVCTDLGIEGSRCVKTTPGCDTDLDCVFGFSCEAAECVDRRVPCIRDDDCPKGHICEAVGESTFCHRVQLDCETERDCLGLAPRCADIDGDGSTECAGALEPNVVPVACVNADCAPATPVCEISGVYSISVCGQYGLCLDDDDCVDGFECVGLWNDGRRECVPTGGSCAHITDCPVRQICASARTGGPPGCQAGVE